MPALNPRHVQKEKLWWSKGAATLDSLSNEERANINMARQTVVYLTVMGEWSLQDNEALMRALLNSHEWQTPTDVLNEYLSSRPSPISNIISDNISVS